MKQQRNCLPLSKVAQRLSKDREGKVLRRKGDVYFVDCNVTGSNEGTAKDPKFSLLQYFKHAVFPEIESLTSVGGTWYGYTPVIQGDNAGPHCDFKFKRFVEDHCRAKGWLWAHNDHKCHILMFWIFRYSRQCQKDIVL